MTIHKIVLTPSKLEEMLSNAKDFYCEYKFGRILDYRIVNGIHVIWVSLDDSSETGAKSFRLIMMFTGKKHKWCHASDRYIGTQVDDGGLVWHLFQKQ